MATCASAVALARRYTAAVGFFPRAALNTNTCINFNRLRSLTTQSRRCAASTVGHTRNTQLNRVQMVQTRRSSDLASIQAITSLQEYRKLHNVPRHMPVEYFSEYFGQQGNNTKKVDRQILAHLKALQQEEVEAATVDTQWTLAAAVSVERYKRLTDDITPEEIAWSKFQEQINLEKTALFQMEVDFEKQQGEEAARAKSEDRRLGADFAEQDKFVPAPRLTAADEEDDRTSVHRKLAQKLFLLLKHEADDVRDEPWRMPQALHIEGESLRETAARSLKSVIDPETELHFVSNAPSYCQTILNTNGGDKLGVKVFYFRAAVVSVNPVVALDTTKYSQFQWLTKSELKETSETYFKDIGDFVE
eukprot:m.23927 g.23927  ORF g.23927 m.23927 type:complete len:362 (-) comp14414_c0_seq1:90-1175(-)